MSLGDTWPFPPWIRHWSWGLTLRTKLVFQLNWVKLLILILTLYCSRRVCRMLCNRVLLCDARLAVRTSAWTSDSCSVFKELKRDESASKSTATTIASTVLMFECIVSRLCFQWRVVNVDVKIDYKAVHVTFSLFS